MDPALDDGLPRRRRGGVSRRGQQLLWGALVGVAGMAVGWDLRPGDPVRLLLSLLVGVACGAAFAETLSRALPLLGAVLGPLFVLAVMNVQRLTVTDPAARPVLQRGGAGGPQTLGYLAAAVAMLASAVSVAIVLWALSRKIRGERRSLRRSARSLAWTCFWIALVMVLISNFAAA